MINLPITRTVLALLAAVAILGLMRFRPWAAQSKAETTAGAREKLVVGYLPVT